MGISSLTGIGVLAIQGNFESHCKRLTKLKQENILVKTTDDLNKVKGLIIPGGESSVLLKLLTEDFKDRLVRLALDGLPIFGTCAGVILLAKHVENPAQESLALLDIDVKRNAYGRQVDSFITSEVNLTKEGQALVAKIKDFGNKPVVSSFEGVFIRAPQISRVGKAATILATHKDTPVLVKQNNIYGATFHPELSETEDLIHQLFISEI